MSDSILLLKESWRILQKDKRLIVIPFITLFLITLLLILWGYLGFLFKIPEFEANNVANGNSVFVIWFSTFYLVANIINNYFQGVLVANALVLIEGGNPGLSYGFKVANQKILQLTILAIFSSTIGLILDYIQEKLGILGRIINEIGSLTWSLVSYLTIPLIIANNLNALNAVKESAKLFKKTWGEQVIGRFSLNIINILFVFIDIPIIIGGFLIAQKFGLSLFPVAIFLCILILIISTTFTSSLNTIYQVALYYFASTGQIPLGFDEKFITNAFKPKNNGKQFKK